VLLTEEAVSQTDSLKFKPSPAETADPLPGAAYVDRVSCEWRTADRFGQITANCSLGEEEHLYVLMPNAASAPPGTRKNLHPSTTALSSGLPDEDRFW
jgi:hypothetical protein